MQYFIQNFIEILMIDIFLFYHMSVQFQQMKDIIKLVLRIANFILLKNLHTFQSLRDAMPTFRKTHDQTITNIFLVIFIERRSKIYVQIIYCQYIVQYILWHSPERIMKILNNKLLFDFLKKLIVFLYFRNMQLHEYCTPKNMHLQTTALQNHNYQQHNDEILPEFQTYNYKVPSYIDQNLQIIKNNLVKFCMILLNTQHKLQLVHQYQKQLLIQLNFIQQPEKVTNLQNQTMQKPQLQFADKIQNFIEILRYLYTLKTQNKENNCDKTYENIIEGYIDEMKTIINNQSTALERLKQYDTHQDSLYKFLNLQVTKSKQELSTNHYGKQLLNFNIELSPSVFSNIAPQLHTQYISQAAKAFHTIAPFKIKHIVKPSIYSEKQQDLPEINTTNYFHLQCQIDKKILFFPVPESNKVIRYKLSQISNQFTIGKELCNESIMNNIKWNFSNQTKTTITNMGRVFAINCRDQPDFIDDNLYEIHENKIVTKSHKIPQPRKQSGFIYLNNNLYVLGGCVKGLCSKNNWKYNIKQKKWTRIAQSNVAVRKPTLCTFNNRFIIKIGGMSQFNYINKVIQIYDSLKNTWSIVRASPKSILQQVEILEDSLAVQINQYQIYIFGGKNTNKFQTDSGFVLSIMQIIQKIKKPVKVKGQLWNVTIGYKNMLSFFGLLSMSNIIVHNNCIYTLRKNLTQPMIN